MLRVNFSVQIPMRFPTAHQVVFYILSIAGFGLREKKKKRDCIGFCFCVERNKEICLHQVKMERGYWIAWNLKIYNEMCFPVCISERKLLSKCRTLCWCSHAGRSQLCVSCSVLQ